MIHNDIKKSAESGDISSLKYFFCDCLDGDPTFAEYEEDYEYCKSKGVLFVPHTELHPMSCSSVDEEYWIQLKKDFMQNPSIERMEHMREVAKILYSDRIRKIEEENARKADLNVVPKVTHAEPIQSVNSPEKPVELSGSQVNSAVYKTPRFTNQAETIDRVSGSNSDEVRRVSERVQSANNGTRRESEPLHNTSTYQGTQQKKDNGVGCIAGVVIAVVAIVVIFLINR